MANTDYLQQLPLFVNGTLQEEVQSISMNGNPNLQEVITMTKGLAGFSQGAKKVTLDVAAAVPIGGPEFDFWNRAQKGDWIDVQVGVGPGDFASRGKITDVKISGASDKSVDLTWQWTGPFTTID